MKDTYRYDFQTGNANFQIGDILNELQPNISKKRPSRAYDVNNLAAANSRLS